VAKDRENMIKVFIANKLFQNTNPEDFKNAKAFSESCSGSGRVKENVYAI